MPTSLAVRERRDLFSDVAWGVCVFLVYSATAFFGHALNLTTVPAVIWPAAGVALAALILRGYIMAVPVFFGALLFEYLSTPLSPVLLIGLAFANTLQPLVAALVLRAFQFEPSLSRLRDGVVFVCTAITVSLVVPLIGMALVVHAQVPLPMAPLPYGGWWWLEEMLSILTITPFLVSWLSRAFIDRSLSDYLEALAALIILVGITYVLFWTSYTEFNGVPLVYLMLLPLIWIAFRSGPRIMTLGLLTITVLGMSAVIHASLGEAQAAMFAKIFAVQLFFVVIIVLFLLFTSLAEERKEATRVLRQYIEQLERESLAKNDFLAALAHELRNPLAPLLSSLELMKVTELSPEHIQAKLASMRRRVRTMARLLDDLLDISRISREKLILKRERFDARIAIERAIETIEPAIRTKDHTLRAFVPDTSVEIDADLVRVEQIVVNLLTNAAKYTAPKGTITLSLEEEAEHIRITVQDTGVGITPELLENIFEPFTQGESARRTEPGIGIGLALTKNLVELHEGTVEAKSEGPGYGATFIVHLPRATAFVLTSENRESPEAPSETAEHIPLSVLVVDDNQAAADALVELLQAIGHKARASYDGASALWEALAQDPEVALLDVALPDMDGYTLGKKLREQGSKAAFIALTGYGSEQMRERAEDEGFFKHLTKPVGIAELNTVLQQISRKH